ncbi:MAG: ankyrin repeat domain-containing protein [Rubrivivax sp.]|nr:ankyrin repeat domain-containing protein [Rubrivivax sp.]
MRICFRSFVYLFAAFGVSLAVASSYVQFFRALDIDDAGTVAQLLARGFDPNAANEKGDLALVMALRDGSPKVAEVLLAHPELKVDAVNASDENALMMAALRGNLAVARRLLDRGAAVNRPGWTPLHYAASGPESRMVALLLDRGARIDAAAPNGNTPLMMAARYGTQEGAELLLARGASAAPRNRNGLAAADFARAVDRERLAQRLEQAAR